MSVRDSPPGTQNSRVARIIGVGIAATSLWMAARGLGGAIDVTDAIDLGQFLAALPMALVGAFIIFRTGHRIGYVAAATGSLQLLGGASSGFDNGFAMWIYGLGLLVFLFPDGLPVSPRWRWLLWLATGAVVINVAFELGGDGVASRYSLAADVGILVLFWFLIAAVVSLVVRYRRSTGIERLQMKWFVFAAASLLVLDLAWEQLATVLPLPELFWDMALVLGFLGLPLSIGVAVLRYKLFSIDRIISRTVSYALILIILAAVYLGGVSLITSLLPSQDAVAVAASTLAVAAMVNPLRLRVHRRIDRRFNRSRFDSERVSEDLAESLRNLVEPQAIADLWVGAVTATMQPSSAAVWLRGNTEVRL